MFTIMFLQKKKKTNKKEGSESEKPDSESDDNANIKLEPTPKLQVIIEKNLYGDLDQSIFLSQKL